MLNLKNLFKIVEKELKNSMTSRFWQTADVQNSEWENFEVLFNQKGFYLISKQDFANVAKLLKNKCSNQIIKNTQDNIIRNIYNTLNHKNQYKYYGKYIYAQYYNNL